MKTNLVKASARIILLASITLVSILYANNKETNNEPNNIVTATENNENTKIQVALLLDTSSSMDGLIDQAKARLWNIVNTLSTLKYEGKTPVLEISLYEYGNDGLSEKDDYIRQVSKFTTDLDLLSEKLFALHTNGGQEYCGAVIKKSLTQLEWDAKKSSLKLIYIAGNEGFNQGSTNYIEAISSAVSKQIFINTIYCGDRQNGISELWQAGAKKGEGKYFNIDQNRTIRYIETPYDADIDRLNKKLNDTYYGYGSLGTSKKANQLVQDSNAGSMNKAIYAERAVTKSKAAYKNESWDMVDAYKKDATFADKVKQDELPSEFKNLSKEQLKAKLTETDKQRTDIQKEIEIVAKKRAVYIEENSNKDEVDDLAAAITSSILEVASKYNYKVEK